MRVAVDARPLLAPTTGIGRYTKALIDRLATASTELFLYSHRPLPAVPEGAHQRTKNFSNDALGSACAQACFARWTRQDAADVFWSPRHHLPLTISGPAVVTIHDMVWRHYPETMQRTRRYLEAFLMPRALKRAARIIAVSQATAADICDFNAAATDKITVIEEATDLRPSADAVPELRPTPYILFVGTLEPRKNLGRVINAFATLKTKGSIPHRLVIAGNRGWKNTELQQALKENIQHIDLRGSVGDETLLRLYTHADFVVAPSLYEGFGLPVVEAMTFGKPVVTSNVSSLPEVAGDAAVLVNPLSTEEIGDAMRRLAVDRAFNQTLADRSLDQATKFSWDRAAQQTLAVLKNAASC